MVETSEILMSTSTLSVIVPTLNESNHIHQTLRRIREKGGDFLIEIWVVDAGSTDGTPDLAAPFASVLHSYRGRALQMNVGAALASGDVLLFCHGDTLLPRDYASQI